MKNGAITAYFDGILNAEAPDRFSIKFLEGLGFTSTNDRLLIGILKDLGFLNADGAPQERYFQFLDKDNSPRILAEGIKEAYSDLFAVNKSAHTLSAEEAYNKLRTLYKGEKKDSVIKMIARTFSSLCEYANFENLGQNLNSNQKSIKQKEEQQDVSRENLQKDETKLSNSTSKPMLKSLQYHINIVLPDTRDQAVYDAIFKSMRDHLG